MSRGSALQAAPRCGLSTPQSAPAGHPPAEPGLNATISNVTRSYYDPLVLDLTKAQKHALREAARLAHQRDTSMSLEDRDVHYLQARTPELPIVVGAAVVNRIISIDEVGEAARSLVADLASRIAAARESLAATGKERPAEEDTHDPSAVISIAAIMQEVDMLSASAEAALYVNRRTGEVFVSIGSDFDELGDDIDPEADDEWEYLLNRDSLDEMLTMKKFARNARPATAQELLDALSGRGAYGRFREVIRRRGLQHEWDSYREERIADHIRWTLRQRKLPFRK